MTISIETQDLIEQLLRLRTHPSMAATSRAAGVSYNTLQSIAKRLGLWAPNQGRKGFTGHSNVATQIPLQDILEGRHPSYATSSLKKRLVRAGLLLDECAECQIGRIWQGRELALQLDHVNGDSNDHRLSNLRILCPNCHSQTETYAGKGNAKEKAPPGVFKDVKHLIVASLLAGESIRQSIIKAGLPAAKWHYESVRLLQLEYPALVDAPALKSYQPKRTLKTKRSPGDYRKQQHELWLAAQAVKLDKLHTAPFDFQRFGWATQVACLLDMHPQKVVPWIRKVDPDFLNKCKLRSSRA